MSKFTLELLESLVEGDELTTSKLDELLQSQVPEDLHIEYKHGNELQKPDKQAQRTIRQYVSGFANSAGGVLIIGVDEATWQVSGCTPPGSSTLAQWAARCLTPIAPQLSPPPRISVVAHPAGEVLVIATLRSLSPVNVVESSKPVYYLRHHDETLLAEEYLVSDLLLGRRNHPMLQIVDAAIRAEGRETNNGIRELVFGLEFYIENQGLSKVRNVKLGLLHLAEGQASMINSNLLSHIEILKLPKESCFRNHNRLSNLLQPDRPADGMSLEPFAVTSLMFTNLRIPVRQNTDWFPYPWKAAVYLLPEGSPPNWYQMSLDLSQDNVILQITSANNGVLFASQSEVPSISKLHGERPVIGWETQFAS